MKPLCKKTAYLLLFLLGAAVQAKSQVVAVNDTIKTGPSQKVKFDVTHNDSFSCSTYTLSVTGITPPASGIATFEGDFLVFTPAPGVTNQTVTVGYTLACQGGGSGAATAIITVGAYNLPLNVVQTNDSCINMMPNSVEFDIETKFIALSDERYATAADRLGGHIQMFQIPLVGDLNGDGKPEIVALGTFPNTTTPAGPNAVASGSLTTYGRRIYIFDGQTGDKMLRFELNSLGTGYGNFQLGSLPYHQSPSYMALADVDNDGIGEIILCESKNQGMVYALKPTLDAQKKITSLTKMWDGECGHKAPLTGNFAIYGQPIPNIADINGDGTPELIVHNKIYNARTGKLLMAWGGTAVTPAASSLAPGTGLDTYNPATSSTSNVSRNAAMSNNVRARAMIGRRPSGAWSTDINYSEPYIAVPAIVDIDDDGLMEIVTGNRIHKFSLTYLGNNGESGDHTQNTYTTIDGPTSATAPINTTGTATATFYFNDGFTRVADIDGDGNLEAVVFQNATGRALQLNILVYVWDLETKALEAVNSVYSIGDHGTFGIPFVGDINDHLDGRDVAGGAFTKKLPEICFIAGRVYINRTPGDYDGRTGMPRHPQSNMSNLRAGNNVIIAVTYDGGEANIESRLKLSWVLEHTDYSDNTGITMFDFNNDNAFDLCYRDENTIRVISPKLGPTDYIYNNATELTNSAILFRQPAYSDTGYEAPVIADVNLDGSADIVVTAYTYDIGYAANIHVFEHASGKPQWAPSPPVWNQALYNPLYINEDLTVPARPISMLTEYTKNNETIRPYNGAWIQQPIVREGDDYIPIYRHPDAVIDSMAVEWVTTSVRVKVIVRNEGLASISTTTPIHLYQTAPGSSTKENIHTSTVGVDIFPGEKVTLEYVMAADAGKIIHCRIMDDGTSFPATGFADCNIANNYGTIPIIRANNDSYTVNRQSPTTLNVIANDSHVGTVSLEVVRQPQYGTVTVNADKLSYTATHATAARDTLRYVLKCEDGSFAAIDTAEVYVVITNTVLPDNIITGTGSDCFVPFDEIIFDIRQKWYSPTGTAHGQTGALVGDLDGDHVPEIITIGSGLSTLNVLDSNDGTVRYSMSIPSMSGSSDWNPVITAALVDSDGNGKGEIIFADTDLNVTSYEANTVGITFSLMQKWTNTYDNVASPGTNDTGKDRLPQPFVADFNNDGVPEVVVYNRIFNAQTGALLGYTESNINAAYVGRIANRPENGKTNFLTAADFDGDGKPELAAGGKIYKVDINPAGTTATCSILYDTNAFGDGFTAAADLDLDGMLEVVVIDYGTVDTRINIWNPLTDQVQHIDIPDSDEYQGYPFIGDIDGMSAVDGKRYPEICVVTKHLVSGTSGKVSAYKYDPVTQQYVLKWEFLNSDTSGGTGITLFDFNDDGVNELVYRDADSIRILNGVLDGVAPTLTSPSAKFLCTSGTAFEYPVIVDVDGSGSAKICVTCSNNAANVAHTLNVFESNNSPWSPTRRVWNQVSYEPTLINNDLTVTRYPFPKQTPFEIDGDNYYPYNGTLIQVPIMDLSLDPVVNAADPHAISVHATQLSPTTARVSVAIENLGHANISSSLPVTLYAGSIAVANVIATKPLGETLAPGDTLTLTFDILTENLPTILVARVQDDGTEENTAISEHNDCNLDNNTAMLYVLLAVDDYISPEKDKVFTANIVANDVLGLCSTTNIEVTIDGNPLHGTVTIMPDNSISYTPATDFVGTDTFTYKITCGSESSTATVTVVVNSTIMVEKVADASEPNLSGRFRIRFADAGFTFSKDLEVRYIISAANANAGVDYAEPSDTVILPANAQYVDVTIVPINNFIVEGNTREVTLIITNITILP